MEEPKKTVPPTHPKHEELAAGWWSTYSRHREKCDLRKKGNDHKCCYEVNHRRYLAISVLEVLTDVHGKLANILLVLHVNSNISYYKTTRIRVPP